MLANNSVDRGGLIWLRVVWRNAKWEVRRRDWQAAPGWSWTSSTGPCLGDGVRFYGRAEGVVVREAPCRRSAEQLGTEAAIRCSVASSADGDWRETACVQQSRRRGCAEASDSCLGLLEAIVPRSQWSVVGEILLFMCYGRRTSAQSGHVGVDSRMQWPKRCDAMRLPSTSSSGQRKLSGVRATPVIVLLPQYYVYLRY